MTSPVRALIAAVTGVRVRRGSAFIGRVVCGLVMAAFGFALSFGVAKAAVPRTGIESLGVQVSDAELSDMRGRFVAPSGIAYFGIEMQSSWQGSDGVTTFATILFNVEFASDAAGTPQLLIGWSRDCADCADPTMDVAGFGPAAQNGYVAITPAGLNTVEGVVQTQNINGADNHVVNTMSIAVVPASAVDRPDTTGLIAVSGGQTQSFSDGDAIHFIVEPGQLAMALTSGQGPDAIRQSINSDMNQIAQNVLLESSLNNINNFVGLTIGLHESEQLQAPSVDNALSAMKGNGF